MLRHAVRGYRTLYEVNGLPFVELPHVYPLIAPRTLEKIRSAEGFCLDWADHIVAPAHSIAERLAERGVTRERITVIPNGADPDNGAGQSPAPWPYILYFGAVQPWQGLDTLLRAFARLQDFRELRLVLCSSVHHRRTKPYRRLIERLGLGGRVHWEYTLSRDALAPWRRHALLSVAPLSECARNLEQGCSPLKVLESMAAGVPVVGSDLPSLREIMVDGEHGRLVPPDRPADLARAIRILLEYPQPHRRMGEQARRHLETHYTWDRPWTGWMRYSGIPAAGAGRAGIDRDGGGVSEHGHDGGGQGLSGSEPATKATDQGPGRWKATTVPIICDGHPAGRPDPGRELYQVKDQPLSPMYAVLLIGRIPQQEVFVIMAEMWLRGW